MTGVASSGTRLESVALLAALPVEVRDVIRPLVQPLLEQWDSLVGDHEAVREAADRWRSMGRHLDDLGRRQHRTVEDTGVGWVGLAAGGWTVAGAEVGRGLEELADRSLDVGDCLDEAASAVHETERLVRDLVRELLEWAALTLAVSAVTGLVTLGASTLAGAASAAAKAAVTGSRIAALVRRLAAVLRRIQDRVDAYRGLGPGPVDRPPRGGRAGRAAGRVRGREEAVAGRDLGGHRDGRPGPPTPRVVGRSPPARAPGADVTGAAPLSRARAPARVWGCLRARTRLTDLEAEPPPAR